MIIGVILIIILIGLDQGLKYLAQYLLSGKTEAVVWIPKSLEFFYVENSGAAWGLFQGKQLFFFIITIVALIAFGYMFTKSNFRKRKVYSLSIVFLIAGTIGNALDRLILGYVIDFIHIPFLTPILGVVKLSNFWFNIADLLLTVGIVLLIIDLLFIAPKRSNEREKDRSIYEVIESKDEQPNKNWCLSSRKYWLFTKLLAKTN